MRASNSTYTPERGELFLKRLAQIGTVATVCKRLGIPKQCPYNWKKFFPEFAKRWEEISQEKVK